MNIVVLLLVPAAAAIAAAVILKIKRSPEFKKGRLNPQDIQKKTLDYLNCDIDDSQAVKSQNEQGFPFVISGELHPHIAEYNSTINWEDKKMKLIITLAADLPDNLAIEKKDKAEDGYFCGDRSLGALQMSTDSESHLTALLNKQARSCLQYLARHFIVLHMEKTIIELHTSFRKYIKKEKILWNSLAKTAELAGLLADDTDTAVLLERNIKNDPVPAVVINNLKEYKKDYLQKGKVPDFIKDLVFHSNKTIACEAIDLAGSEGLDLLKNIIINKEKKFSVIQRRNAIESLAERDPRGCVPFFTDFYLSANAPRSLRFTILYALSDIIAAVDEAVILKALENGTNDEKQIALNMAAAMNMNSVLPQIHAICEDDRADYFLKSRAANTAASIIGQTEHIDAGQLSIDESEKVDKSGKREDRTGALSNAEEDFE